MGGASLPVVDTEVRAILEPGLGRQAARAQGAVDREAAPKSAWFFEARAMSRSSESVCVPRDTVSLPSEAR